MKDRKGASEGNKKRVLTSEACCIIVVLAVVLWLFWLLLLVLFSLADEMPYLHVPLHAIIRIQKSASGSIQTIFRVPIEAVQDHHLI